MPTFPPAPSGAADAGRSATAVTIACDPLLMTFLLQFDHDVRTPLGTMAAVVDLLRDEPAHSETHVESIAVLERQIARLHALTQGLREFAGELDRRRGDALGG